MTKDKHFIFKALAIALFCIFLLPILGQEGIFSDGLIYGTIAQKLAEGKGSFWTPYCSEFFYPEFFEHLPLALDIQSVFFKVFGHYHWVERLHSLFLAILTAVGIALVWRTALPKFKEYFWLPLIFWITIPLVAWSINNNMLENTVNVFNIFGVYFILKSLKTEKQGIQWIFLSALFLLFGFLSKGIPTIFPLAALGCYAVSHFQFSKKIILSQVLLVVFWAVLLFVLMTLIPEAKNNIDQTITKQLGSTQTVVTKDSRFFIIGRLFLDLLPIWILGIGILGWKFLKQKSYFLENNKTLKMSAFWLLIGFSGILPIMLSTKQSGYYIVPATMFFALGLASAILPAIIPFLQKISNQSWFKHINTLSFFIIGFSFFLMTSNWNTYNRDEGLIGDIKIIGEAVDVDEMSIQSHPKLKWNIFIYFMRYENISLEKESQMHYVVGKKGIDVLDEYKEVDLDLKELVLFERIDSAPR
jgi:hypothetical protein